MTDSSSADSRARDLAHNVLANGLRVRRGENVTIETWTKDLPEAQEFVVESRRLEARPLLIVQDEPTFWRSIEEGLAPAMAAAGDHEWGALRKTHAYVYFWGPADARRIDALDPKTDNLVTAWNSRWYEIASRAKVRYARIELGKVSPEAAEAAGLDYQKWRDEILDASLVNPKEMLANGKRVARVFGKGRKVHIAHSNGTDLTLRLRHRPVHVEDGCVDANDLRRGDNVTHIPSGVAAMSIDEAFADGTFRANLPAPYGSGSQRRTGGRWTFANGGLVDYSFETGLDSFRTSYSNAPKGKEKPGRISVGLNPRLMAPPRLEDQGLGTVMVSIGGNGFMEGKTRIPWSSALLLQGADVEVDGRPILREGVFT